MRYLLPRTPRVTGKDKRSGSALVLGALSCLVLVPMLGLAVDGANVYILRNQLLTALDAAALAGARTGQSQSVAQTVFYANVSGIPFQNLTFSFPAPPNKAGFVLFSAQATVTLPLMLMKFIPGVANPTITLTATAQRPVANVMLVVDQSDTMASGDGSGALSSDAVNQALAVVNTFTSQDNIGLIGFTANPLVLDKPLSGQVPQIVSDINSLVVPSVAAGSNIPSVNNTSGAMTVAYQTLQSLSPPAGSVNIIVLFTNSLPVAFNGDFSNYLKSGGICKPAPGAPVVGVLWGVPGLGALADPTTTVPNDFPESRWAPACNIASAPAGVPQLFLTGLPPTDQPYESPLYYNSTNGSAAPLTPGLVNVNEVDYASENALNDAASRIRSDATLAPVIFVVDLQSGGWEDPAYPKLLQQVVNVPSSSVYNPSQPSGQYLSLPQLGELQSALAAPSKIKLLQQ